MSKIIVTCAITGGIHTPTMSPYLPITPREIADEVVKASEAGAAIAHIHARNPKDGSPTADASIYKEIVSDVYSRCDIILCFTTGGSLGMSLEDRLSVIPNFEPELASCNAGSFNFSIFPLAEKIKNFKFDWEKDYLERTEDFIFPNTFKTLAQYCQTFAKYDTKAEFEVYDSAMINNIGYLVNKGYTKGPVHIQFVMGVLGGMTPTVDNLVFLKQTADKVLGDYTWSVAAAGKNQMQMCATALAMGGNIRVGLEDSLYLRKGVLAKSNAELVEKAVLLVDTLGLEVATADDARKILALKGKNKILYK